MNSPFLTVSYFTSAVTGAEDVLAQPVCENESHDVIFIISIVSLCHVNATRIGMFFIIMILHYLSCI